MEWLVLGLFCGMLLSCIALDLPILWALGAGLLLFLAYGVRKGFPLKELLKTALNGVLTVRNILLTFMLIGVLTALWRAAGTIPYIVVQATKLIRPSVFVLMTFLLNAGVSVLTGTAFGTAATMGVICAAMGAALGVSPFWTGGAVLSGVFFGDRCSPVSTSALLVAQLTGTNIFDNIRSMIRSAAVPFALTCAVYLIAGTLGAPSGALPDLSGVFSREFTLTAPALIPAAVILILSLLRVNVKAAMAASILTAVPLCLLRGMDVITLLRTALTGFVPHDPQVAAMVSGGGVTSMLRVAGIVCLSSSYAGIFQKTGLLDPARDAVSRLAGRLGRLPAMGLTSILCGMVACNQTLCIMLTHQLCGGLDRDGASFALDLEDTAVVLSALIPWSIAAAVPLASVGAPLTAIAAGCYLYLLPLWRMAGRR